MGSFYPDARTQQHVPICNAIEAGDFRQALKLVDKRLAKTSDTYLLVSNFHLGAEHIQWVAALRHPVTCPVLLLYSPPSSNGHKPTQTVKILVHLARANLARL